MDAGFGGVSKYHSLNVASLSLSLSLSLFSVYSFTLRLVFVDSESCLLWTLYIVSLAKRTLAIMTAAADVRFKLNTGAEIPALGLGRFNATESRDAE